MVFDCFEVCITLDRVVTKPVVIHNTLFIDIYISVNNLQVKVIIT